MARSPNQTGGGTSGAPVVDSGNGGDEAAGVPARVDMVVLSARDLPLLRRFYRALGWPERSGASDALATFGLGAIDLALYPDTSPTGTDGPRTERSGPTLVVRLDAADQVDGAFALALRAGGLPVAEPQDHAWGGRSAVLADPEGNRWELLWVARTSAVPEDDNR
jgi:catechol 2,3-dioxygenase-like lactoylglutathione lyase family enzyme